MLKDVMGFGFLFTGMPYNSWYKQHRAMFHKHFRRGAIPNYHSIQYKHINTLLRNLIVARSGRSALLDRHGRPSSSQPPRLLADKMATRGRRRAAAVQQPPPTTPSPQQQNQPLRRSTRERRTPRAPDESPPTSQRNPGSSRRQRRQPDPHDDNDDVFSGGPAHTPRSARGRAGVRFAAVGRQLPDEDDDEFGSPLSEDTPSRASIPAPSRPIFPDPPPRPNPANSKKSKANDVHKSFETTAAGRQVCLFCKALKEVEPERQIASYGKTTATGPLRDHLAREHLAPWVDFCDKFGYKITAGKEILPLVEKYRREKAGHGEHIVEGEERTFPPFNTDLLVDYIATFVCDNDQSINVVENRAFRDILLFMRSELKDSDIPHRSMLRERILQLWRVHVDKLAAEMQEHMRYGMQDKLGWITLDNASNNETFMAALEVALRRENIRFDAGTRRIRCFPHMVNLACKAVIEAISELDFVGYGEDDSILHRTVLQGIERDLFDAVRSIVRVVRISSLRRHQFAEVLRSLDLEVLQLLRDVDTRWSALLLMIERALLLRPGIEKFLQEQELQRSALRDQEWRALELFKDVLSIPHAFQQRLSAEKTPTLSYAIPYFEAMTRAWEKMQVAHPELRNVIQRGLDKLGTYENHILPIPAYTLAHLLNPAMKNYWVMKHRPEKAAAARELLISEANKKAPNVAAAVNVQLWGLLGFTVKYVPAWFPGAAFKRRGHDYKRLSRRLLNYAFDSVKQKLVRALSLPLTTCINLDAKSNGCAEPSLMTTELERLFRDSLPEERALEKETIIKDVAATTYAAGSDTTLSALLSFFLATTLHPEVQMQAQAQLARIVPAERLPTFADRATGKLPYVECIVWECLRWNPPANLALGHMLTEEDEYRGWRIPKGTTCLANLHAMLHDPERYPNPEKFNPSRFLDKESNCRQNINPVPEFEFGFGRRMCPGRFLALDTLWLAIASTLHVYQISKAIDRRGREVEPRVRYKSGLISLPERFECAIVPRSEEMRKLVDATREL
ncbi:HAT family dimerization domain-containing protein [Mycena kentingensis (nom. inval.)]|nr:HAT family dimerization domain-containing protein [Mycena kentingensis (nom. inval.)]